LTRSFAPAGLVAAAALVACTGPTFEVAELPDAPIALVYRTVEEGERVLDLLQQEENQAKGKRPEFGTLAVELERLGEIMGPRRAEDVLREQFGRMSFYVAPAQRLEPAGFASRGARPLEWSADRTRLLFSGSSSGSLQLFEWHVATGEVRQRTQGARDHTDGCYGPDGALAYVEVARGPTSRIIVERPGEAARAVTQGPADGQPTWSGAAGRLVYVSFDPRQGEFLRWVDPETGDGGALTRGRSPVFTPDGQWLVYSAPTPAGWKLWRMRADGSAKRSFGASGFHENDPAVSPDGRFVVFAGTKQERSATSRLFVRPLDGSPDRQLEMSGSALLPVW
jgi:Tol biopolymer transport system component